MVMIRKAAEAAIAAIVRIYDAILTNGEACLRDILQKSLETGTM